MISYVMPTRDRPLVLAHTLEALGRLPRHEAQVIIVDNASTYSSSTPRTLDNGIRCELIRLSENRSAAARNLGVERAVLIAGRNNAHWVVMLDDDSQPLDIAHVGALANMPEEIGAVGAEVFLPPLISLATASLERERHESGGLPEVFIGCGAAIRAGEFLDLGGYDPAFDYYAEEYDFCARILLSGRRVVHDRRFRVLHRKVDSGRDFNRIVSNLVRNNVWVMARYAPPEDRSPRILGQFLRYASIARNERALRGYARGAWRALQSIDEQRRTPLPREAWDRFTGYAAAIQCLRTLMNRDVRSAAIVYRGKGVEQIERAARDVGLALVDRAEAADVRIIGSLSPGVILDRMSESQSDPTLVAPWLPGSCAPTV